MIVQKTCVVIFGSCHETLPKQQSLKVLTVISETTNFFSFFCSNVKMSAANNNVLHFYGDMLGTNAVTYVRATCYI